jgi:hypothetical protein
MCGELVYVEEFEYHLQSCKPLLEDVAEEIEQKEEEIIPAATLRKPKKRASG